MQLNTLTLTQTLKGLSKKQFSLPELYAALSAAVKKTDPTIKSYLTLNPKALDQAQKRADLPLAGIPIAVKDNFCTTDLRTTAASTVLDNFVPQFESTVTRRLQDAGGVVFGKTNLDAWAHGSSTETSQYQTTRNPRNTDHLPGGSSGGSAAAVAADLCIAALGTETAGSIRQPAAWCGTVGLKPTYGRVSRYGIVAMASSTDSPGPITKTVADSALLLDQIAGHDPFDGTTSPRKTDNFSAAIGSSIKGLKVGYIYHDIAGIEAANATLESQLTALRDAGAIVEKADALTPKHAIGVYTIVQRGEVSSNLARFDGVRYGADRSLFGDEAKRRIMLGTHTLSAGYADQYYNTAQKVRTLYITDFERLFKKYDVLVNLTSPGFAKPVGASEGAAMFGELEDMLLEPSSIAGLPGINVPCHQDPDSGLFLGMSITAPFWQESTMISVAHAFEQATQHNTWTKK